MKDFEYKVGEPQTTGFVAVDLEYVSRRLIHAAFLNKERRKRRNMHKRGTLRRS